MQTDKRLTRAYEKARVLPFDKDSKFIFFSDCHRGDASLSDEFSRNQNLFIHALDYYYHRGFTYIEVGDGDELWEHHRFRHIKKAHYDVFKRIKRFFDDDRLYILYGNHNIYLKNPDYVKKHYFHYYDDCNEETYEFLEGLEPLEALVLKSQESGQEFFVVHGHQGDLVNDQLWFFSMLSLKYFWRFLHAFGIRNPASPVKNAHKRHKIERNYSKWIQKHRHGLICGHTHRVKYPRTRDLPYFNTGSCIYPARITGLEMINATLQMVQWRIMVTSTGVLQVKREIIRGPEPVGKFDIR